MRVWGHRGYGFAPEAWVKVKDDLELGTRGFQVQETAISSSQAPVAPPPRLQAHLV